MTGTYWGLVEEAAHAHPERIVLVDDYGRSLTNAELRDAAERTAAALAQRGIRDGTAVSWQLPTTLEAMVVMEELGRGLMPEPYAAVALVAVDLLKVGAPAVAEPRLRAIAEGREIVVLAHQERTARYRLAHVETKATRSPASSRARTPGMARSATCSSWRSSLVRIPSAAERLSSTL